MNSGDTGAEQLSHLTDIGINEAEREIPKRRLVVMPEALKMKFEAWTNGDQEIGLAGEQFNKIVRFRRHIESSACVVEQKVVRKSYKVRPRRASLIGPFGQHVEPKQRVQERTRSGFITECRRL